MEREKPKPIEIPPEKQKELEEKNKKSYPVGTGKEFLEKRRELALPAVEVKNKVISLNPAFEGTLPFKIEHNRPLPFGLFFTPEDKKEQRRLVVMPESTNAYSRGRSALIGSVVFEDSNGQRYRDIDLKGLGVFYSKLGGTRVEVGRIVSHGPTTAAGIVDYRYALHDWDMTEDLLRAGIRTYRIIAISRLGEILDSDGSKITVEKAKSGKLIFPEMEPVLVVRAFGTKERVDYLSGADKTRQKMALEDAKALVAQELGRDPDNFPWEEYAKWFASTLGQSLARLRKQGLHHGYLSGHNISLDCRIVDNDSVAQAVEKVEEEKKRDPKATITKEVLFSSEYETAWRTLDKFLGDVERVIETDLSFRAVQYDSVLKRSYEKELNAKK